MGGQGVRPVGRGGRPSEHVVAVTSPEHDEFHDYRSTTALVIWRVEGFLFSVLMDLAPGFLGHFGFIDFWRHWTFCPYLRKEEINAAKSLIDNCNPPTEKIVPEERTDLEAGMIRHRA